MAVKLDFRKKFSCKLINMPIIHTQVKYNLNTIFSWKGLPVTKEMTINEFYSQVVKH